MFASGLLVLSFFALALGAPAPDVLHVHDARSAAPAGFKASGAPDASEVLQLRIALKTDNTQLVQRLLDVSTPGSQNYRQFLTKAEVRGRPSSSLVIPLAELIMIRRVTDDAPAFTGRAAHCAQR